MTTTAVVGGGLAGCLVALELAEAGHRVDLFERADALVTGASYWCEGKLHLGFVYALDTSLRTARAMIAGAATFVPLTGRWIPVETMSAAMSDPFVYAVPSGSLVGAAPLEAYFDQLSRLWDEYATVAPVPATGSRPIWRRLTDRERAASFDANRVIEAYQVNEVAIGPRAVADGIRGAVAAAPGIVVCTNADVDRLEPTGHSGIEVIWCSRSQQHRAGYDYVVNASWQDRLRLDATAGLRPGRPVIHRYKIGFNGPALPAGLPSVTFVLGEYGDIVAFPDRSYLSWYPVGLLRTSTATSPCRAAVLVEAGELDAIRDESVRALSALMPQAAQAIAAAGDGSEAGGGWITAWGDSGIADPRSELHRRFEIGPTRRGRLVSLDTGKYTTAPLLAHEAAQLILADR